MDSHSECAACRRESLANRVLVSSIGVFAITSIHHAYGAYVYATLWRLHAVVVSGAATLLMVGLLTLSRWPNASIEKHALCSFMILALIVPFLGFGIFEGGYNHWVKDILYLLGVSQEMMLTMFPPRLYELPNNFFFELTGMLQIVPGVLVGYYLFLLLQHARQMQTKQFQTPMWSCLMALALVLGLGIKS